MNETYNSKLQPSARSLRRNMTPEERHLWYDFLKGLTVTIQRQKVIGNYIADFYCSSSKLVIELDGSQHYAEDGIESDIRRDAYFNSLGLRVLRYSNADVNLRFENVCEQIYSFIFKPN